MLGFKKTRKNSKFIYYIKVYLKTIIPSCILRHRLPKILKQAQNRPDFEYIKKRVDYYNQLNNNTILPNSVKKASEITRKNFEYQSVYYHDTHEFIRYFDINNKISIVGNDLTIVPDIPSVVKSRPIRQANIDNTNSVVLKLNKVRHYIFVDDPYKFQEKDNRVIFRGDIKYKPHRAKFIEMYASHPLCDVCDIAHKSETNVAKHRKPISIKKHLKFKYIMALEGNDVSSNLKWIMSSNSIAVMPKPKFETWFMEGTLIPNYHYIEIKADFSDLIERIEYYNTHPHEAEAIVKHANEYVEQFKNKKRERLISLLVLNKYFEKTGQTYWKEQK